MSGEDVLGLLFLAVCSPLLAVGKLGTDGLALLRPLSAGDIDVEDLIQAEVSEQLLIAGVGIQHAEAAVSLLQEMDGGAGEGAEKGGVHHRTMLEIHDEVVGALVQHGLKGALHLNRILEAAAPFDSKPKHVADTADEYVGEGRHGGKGG